MDETDLSWQIFVDESAASKLSVITLLDYWV